MLRSIICRIQFLHIPFPIKTNVIQFPTARRARSAFNGERGTQYERVTVLYYDGADAAS